MSAKRTSITLILSAALVSMITLLLIAFAVFTYKFEKENRWEQLQSTTAVSADQLMAGLAFPAWNLDDVQIMSVMRSDMSNHEIHTIVTTANKKTYILTRDKNWNIEQGSRIPDDPALLVQKRIIFFNDRPVGTVTVFASPVFVEKDLRLRLITIIVFIVVLALAQVAGLSLLLWHIILKPLKTVGAYAATVKAGTGVTAEPQNAWFFGELATLNESIREMIALLDARYLAMKRSEERMHLAASAADLGVWDWDIVKNKLVWDDAMYAQYGVRREDFRGAYDAWLAGVDPEDRERADAETQAAIQGEREFALEYKIRRPDGSVRFMRGLGRTIRDDHGNALRMVGISLDISEQKKTEEELRRHRVHLEELVAERTAALSVAVAQAEAANRTKSVFLSNMSHEIRTPLNAIIGYTQIMQRLPSLSAEQEKYIGIIERSGDHLLSLINDILELSKIEVGGIALQIQKFDFRALMREVELMLKGRAAEKGLTLEIDIEPGFPASIHADATKVRQILINIIGNAIKFTDHGGVTVRTGTQPMNADRSMVCVEVIDTGTGIGQQDSERIFEAFEQTVTGRRKGGTGLGLTISRQYAQMMGGELLIHTLQDKGSTVRFTFHAGLAEETVASGPARRGKIVGIMQDSAKPKILVVDDSAMNREVLRLILRGVGLTGIREAANGGEALRTIGDWRPDIVLMDRRMPGLDGLQTTLAIRELPLGGEIRVIIVTASAFEEDRQAAIAIGADGFVSKPFREEEVLEEIQRVFPAFEYRYEGFESETVIVSSPEDYRSQAKMLDTAIRAELSDSIERGNVKYFEHVIANKVRAAHPALYERLHALLEKFDYVRILELIS